MGVRVIVRDVRTNVARGEQSRLLVAARSTKKPLRDMGGSTADQGRDHHLFGGVLRGQGSGQRLIGDAQGIKGTAK